MGSAGKVWDPEKYPWQTVAKLVVPKQDSFNYELKSFWEDHIRVDPWHGLKTLQPLGGPNRLRRVGKWCSSPTYHVYSLTIVSLPCEQCSSSQDERPQGDKCQAH